MKKAFSLATLLLGAIAAVPSAWGAHLTASQALARLTSQQHIAPSRAGAELNLTATVGNLYVFSGEEGYMILPNDDAAPALLGYSEQCAFDAKSNPNLAYWLEYLNSELDYLAQNPEATAATPRIERAPIAPKIATRWNQRDPYFNDCPVYNGGRCVTGCVATAMAQVIKYHNYPEKGVGTASYTWNGKTLSFDYGNTTFDWNAMLNEYDSSSSAASEAAVAKLMYACGVGVEMNYGTGESGAASQKIPGALIEHFNYDKATYLAQRNAYGIDEWEDLIYNELKENRPVLYGGTGSAGGHEFVCDGYSENGYFHFNWGWGGLSDGYFLLTALNPTSLGTGGGAGGFNFDQDAVIGAQPAKANSQYTYVIYNFESDFATETTSTALSSQVSFSGDFLNSSAVTIPSLYMGIKLQRVGDADAQYVSSTSVRNNFEPNYYFNSYSVTLPGNLEEGQYVVTPAYSVDGQSWQDVRSFLSVNGKLNATVEGNTITFSAPAKANVTVSGISTLDAIYIGKTTPLSYTVTNPGSEEYLGEIRPCLFNAGGTMVAAANAIPVDLVGGASEEYKEIATTFGTIQGQSFTAGNYTLVFCDASGTPVSTPVNVVVKEVPGGQSTIGVTAFSLASTTPVVDKSDVKFSVTAECVAGYVSSSLNIVIFPYTDGNVSSVYSGPTPYFYLSQGESETKTVSLDLSSLDSGKYFAMIYLGNNAASSTQIVFEIKDDIGTGIDEIGADADDSEIIYDLNGIRHSRPLARGIYIINGVKTLIK
ncbi:MAG: hypothetical protein HDS01_07220 [Bacteroides sp.]|nr:hypothetical protein [Bacteroides sp.]